MEKGVRKKDAETRSYVKREEFLVKWEKFAGFLGKKRFLAYFSRQSKGVSPYR